MIEARRGTSQSQLSSGRKGSSQREKKFRPASPPALGVSPQRFSRQRQRWWCFPWPLGTISHQLLNKLKTISVLISLSAAQSSKHLQTPAAK